MSLVAYRMGWDAAVNLARAKWQPIDTAPKKPDRFVFLWCPEDESLWMASWQGDEWYGVDDNGLTRSGHSLGDTRYFTGWFISHWMPLPIGPKSLDGEEGK